MMSLCQNYREAKACENSEKEKNVSGVEALGAHGPILICLLILSGNLANEKRACPSLEVLL
jgi:hypothetical protein